MGTITTSDGTEIYYKDWGAGPVVTFSHGWPLSADAWDGQCSFSRTTGTGRLPMTGEATAARASLPTATKWIPMPTISPR